MTVMEKYLTVEEVAEGLQVLPVTVLRYIKSGELVAHRIGRVYRIAPADLQRFMDARRTTSEKKRKPTQES